LELSDGKRQCLTNCPITHYSNGNSSEHRACLPCYKDCYGCTGPKDTIGVDGCVKCHSALVNNDASYSILKCIDRESYNCTENTFWDLVPENLKEHKLRGKTVCRKCNSECDNCYKNGAAFGTECEKCLNLYSKSNGQCVANCSSTNEYLEAGTSNCLPCNKECEQGCTGQSIYECKQCRAYKVTLSSVKKLIDSIMANQHHEPLQPHSDSDSLAQLNGGSDLNNAKITIQLVENYRNYLVYRENSYLINERNPQEEDDSTVFCVNECPAQLPYKTNALFCTDVKQSHLT
jgi:hypothetical protein